MVISAVHVPLAKVERDAVPSTIGPERNVTVPIGATAPALLPGSVMLTVAVKSSACPKNGAATDGGERPF